MGAPLHTNFRISVYPSSANRSRNIASLTGAGPSDSVVSSAAAYAAVAKPKDKFAAEFCVI